MRSLGFPTKYPHIWARIRPAIERGTIIEEALDPTELEITEEYARLKGKGRLGAGQAAVMAYIRYKGGMVYSNNVNDVRYYCMKHSLIFRTVVFSMFQAYDTGLINKDKGEYIWQIFIKKRRKVHFSDFQSVIECYSSGKGIDQ